MMDENLQKSLSDMIDKQNKLSEENAILRQAAKILLKRGMNADIWMRKGIRASISVEFYEGSRRTNAG